MHNWQKVHAKFLKIIAHNLQNFGA